MPEVCVIGLGYIGLPTAVVLASSRYQVYGVDIKPDVVSSINSAKSHFFEPGLDSLLVSAVTSGRLIATDHPRSADIFVISVPTPIVHHDGALPSPDISLVTSAIISIAPYVRAGSLLLIESTCPIGTTLAMSEVICSHTNLASTDFLMAYCPERVLPGNILNELRTNDRIVGGLSPDSAKAACDFYRSFCNGNIHSTRAEVAETVKLVENSYRDVSIAFANEISMLCGELDISSSEVIKLANYHPRVNILNPGCGVGGHCIAVDPWFLVDSSPNFTPLIQTARQVNNNKSSWVVSRVFDQVSVLTDQLSRPITVGCFGLSFKPDVDDLRESPALSIATSLISSGLNILVCDPYVKSHPSIKLHSADSVLDSSDLIVFLVAHSQFSHFDLSGKHVLDFCSLTS
tara:strand:- start:324 stop:1532 length:1209 start_codon:yes stop_codon:yes gene_type:complete